MSNHALSTAGRFPVRRKRPNRPAVDNASRFVASAERGPVHFLTNDAASKLICLALRNIAADWGRAAKDWKETMNKFAILYAERFTEARG